MTRSKGDDLHAQSAANAALVQVELEPEPLYIDQVKEKQLIATI